MKQKHWVNQKAWLELATVSIAVLMISLTNTKGRGICAPEERNYINIAHFPHIHCMAAGVHNQHIVLTELICSCNHYRLDVQEHQKSNSSLNWQLYLYNRLLAWELLAQRLQFSPEKTQTWQIKMSITDQATTTPELNTCTFFSIQLAIVHILKCQIIQQTTPFVK